MDSFFDNCVYSVGSITTRCVDYVFEKVDNVSYIRPATISFYEGFKDTAKVEEIYADIVQKSNEFFCRRYSNGNEKLTIEKMNEIIEQHEKEFLVFDFTKDEEYKIILEINRRVSYLSQKDHELFERKMKMVEHIIYSDECKSAHDKIEALFSCIINT